MRERIRKRCLGMALGAALAFAVLGHGQAACAQRPELHGLRTAAGEAGCEGAMASGPARYCADQAGFRWLMSQVGYAAAWPALGVARGLGYAGFYAGAAASSTALDSEASYWRAAAGKPTAPGKPNSPARKGLSWLRLEAHKGLPFGLQVSAGVSRSVSFPWWLLGAAIKLSPLEGFRTGLGALPDVALRWSTQALLGSMDLGVRIRALDLIVSKPFVLARVATLSPFLNIGPVWIGAREAWVDLTPETNAFSSCAPEPDRPGTEPTAPGVPKCSGSAGDYANQQRFASFTATRWRTALGVQGRYEQLVAALSVQADLRHPSHDRDVPSGVARQMTANLSVGLRY